MKLWLSPVLLLLCLITITFADEDSTSTTTAAPSAEGALEKLVECTSKPLGCLQAQAESGEWQSVVQRPFLNCLHSEAAPDSSGASKDWKKIMCGCYDKVQSNSSKDFVSNSTIQGEEIILPTSEEVDSSQPCVATIPTCLGTGAEVGADTEPFWKCLAEQKQPKDGNEEMSMFQDCFRKMNKLVCSGAGVAKISTLISIFFVIFALLKPEF